MHRRVVVSGIGVVGPTGVGKEAFWSGLISGRSGIRPVTRFDASTYPCRVAAEVIDETYLDPLEPKKIRRMPHTTRLAVGAARLALNDAGFEYPGYDPFRTGVVVGTSLGSLSDASQQHTILLERGMGRINPLLALATYYHSTAGEVAIEAGAMGTNLTQSVGCASGACAVAVGADLIRSGTLDVCIVGGAESPVTPLVFAGMGRGGELSTLNEIPERASCPFDLQHCGLVVGEGSSVVILEELDHARRRGPFLYAEVLGHSIGCEAHDLYSLKDDDEPAAATLTSAIRLSGLSPDQIDYVSAHGSSCPKWDRKETRVLKRAFGEYAYKLSISSIKSMLGHSFGAAGVFQLAATVLSMTRGIIPPTVNLNDPDPACDLDYTPNAPRSLRPAHSLISNFGYGGVNAFLLLGSAEFL